MVIVIEQGSSKSEVDLRLKKIKLKKGVNTKKYSGKIKLKEDPLAIQKRLRDEWR